MLARTPTYPSLGQSLLLMLTLVALQFALSIAGSIEIAIACLLAGIKPLHDDPQVTALLMITVVMISYAAVLGWGARQARAPLRTIFPLTPFPTGLVLPLLVACTGLGILLSEADNILRHFLPMPGWLAKIFSDLSGGGILSLFLLVVLAPVTEELFFRGLILRGLRSRTSDLNSVMISALLFALVHLNPYQFACPLALGLLGGWLFIQTGSLWPCILMHAFNNGQVWFVANVLRIDIPGYSCVDPSHPPADTFQPTWFNLLGLILLGTGLAILWRMLGSRPNPTPAPAAD